MRRIVPSQFWMVSFTLLNVRPAPHRALHPRNRLKRGHACREARSDEPFPARLSRLHQVDLAYRQGLNDDCASRDRPRQERLAGRRSRHDEAAAALFLELGIAAFTAIPGIGAGDVGDATDGIRADLAAKLHFLGKLAAP